MLLLSFCQLQPNLLSAFVAHRQPSGSSNSGFNSRGGFVVASITTTEIVIMVLDIVDTMVITMTIGSREIGNIAVGFQALNSGPIHSLIC